MNICFLDKTYFQYNSKNLYSKNLRGAETVLINLTKALSNLGHKITIINNCPKTEIIDEINWVNIDSSFPKKKFDLVISNGDCRLFKYASSKNNILFSHSIQTIEKFIRKKQLLSFIKYKPKICFISEYHKINRSKLLYIFGHINLRWSVDNIFLDSEISNNVKNNQAIFTSNKDRNLDLLIDIWKNNIFPHNKNLKLLVNSENDNENSFNIYKRKVSDQQKLLEDLKDSRLYLIPGHKAELFCLAAEEARELCIPIVTLGIGCLKERVEHGVTGYVAKNKEEFSKYTLELFNNNNQWNLLRNNLIKRRSLRTWKKVANELINQII